MAGYTAGPWSVANGCDQYIHADAVWVASTMGVKGAEGAANARLIAVSTIIPDLYASEINARIEWFWDGGFTVAIGDEMNGWLEYASIDDWVDALRWLESAACRHFPESDFAITRATPKDSADA